MPTSWGEWRVGFPFLLASLGSFPGDGLIALPVTIPDSLPPTFVAMQAYVPSELTNLATLQTE